MKKILYSLAVLFCSVLISSCADFLDSENLVKKDTSNMPETIEEADQLVTGAYAAMYEIDHLSHWFLTGNLLADDCLAGGGEGDFLAHAIKYYKMVSPDDMHPAWKVYYQGIFRCNNVLESIVNVKDKSDTKEYNRILGQSYYLRGLYYYYMALTWGTVPIVTTTLAQNNPRATSDEMFQRILSDLKKAIDLLPAEVLEAKHDGRATKWAAEALMARAYLFYDGYYKNNQRADVAIEEGTVTSANVISWLEDCISNGGYELTGDFRNQWPYSLNIPETGYKYTIDNNLQWVREEGANRETIFAVKHSAVGDWSPERQFVYNNNVCTNVGFRGGDHPDYIPFGAGWGFCTVNRNFFENWDDKDVRKTGTVLDLNDPAEGIDNYRWNQWDAWQETGLFFKKYLPYYVKRENGKGWNYSCLLYDRGPGYQIENAQDLVLIRFADVLLMHSEMTKTTTGINRVRTRAGLDPIGTYTDEALRNERRHELAFEALRYYDLLRWYGTDAGAEIMKNLDGCKMFNVGKETTINQDRKGYYNTIAQRIKETGGFMSIPQTEISLSDGVIKQNPGWEGTSHQF